MSTVPKEKGVATNDALQDETVASNNVTRNAAEVNQEINLPPRDEASRPFMGCRLNTLLLYVTVDFGCYNYRRYNQMNDNPFKGLLDARSTAEFIHMPYQNFVYAYRKRPGLNIMRAFGRDFFREDDPALIAWRDERLAAEQAKANKAA